MCRRVDGGPGGAGPESAVRSHLVESVVAEPGLDLGDAEVDAIGGEAVAQLVDVVDERSELFAVKVHSPEARNAREERDAAEGHGEPQNDLGAAREVADVVGHERAARHGGDGGEPRVDVRDLVEDADPHAAEHREEDEPAEVDCGHDKVEHGGERTSAQGGTAQRGGR